MEILRLTTTYTAQRLWARVSESVRRTHGFGFMHGQPAPLSPYASLISGMGILFYGGRPGVASVLVLVADLSDMFNQP